MTPIIIEESTDNNSRTALATVMDKFCQDYLIPTEGNKEERALDISSYQTLQKMLLYQGYERLEIRKSKVKTADGSRPGNLWARSRGNGTIDVLLEEALNSNSRHSGYTYIEFSGPAEYARFLRDYHKLPDWDSTTKFTTESHLGEIIGGTVGVGIGIGITAALNHFDPAPSTAALISVGTLISMVTGVVGIGIGCISGYGGTSPKKNNPYTAFHQAYDKKMYRGELQFPLSRALGLPVPKEEKPAQ